MTNCSSKAGGEPKVRPMAVAGQFYPDNKDTLNNWLDNYFKSVTTKPLSGVRSVIVPHAGYVFSGLVAAEAYACLSKEAAYDHIFLIGPSHHAAFDGASVCNAFDCYETPLGRVDVDVALANKLIADNEVFTYNPKAHDREHCLEVQLPFLQRHLKSMAPIVPIIIGTQDYQRLKMIAEALRPYFNERNLFVISSDFSHYPKYDDARRVDKTTGEAVATGSLAKFLDALQENASLNIPNLATSACGQCAIAVLLMLSEGQKDLHMRHLLYMNSGDSPYGSKSEVVGYHAFCQQVESHSLLSDADKQELLTLARQSIEGRDYSEIDTTKLSAALKKNLGAFVTLTKNGRLRGCIGVFGGDTPLYQVVCEMARAAAFEDPRFPAVTTDEIGDIKIEISVLTPLQRIYDIKDFHYGTQGIFMRKGYHNGTFLPQVAQEVNWTKEEFLGHCARDKAGIGWNGWRDAELYTYEAIIVKE